MEAGACNRSQGTLKSIAQQPSLWPIPSLLQLPEFARILSFGAEDRSPIDKKSMPLQVLLCVQNFLQMYALLTDRRHLRCASLAPQSPSGDSWITSCQTLTPQLSCKPDTKFCVIMKSRRMRMFLKPSNHPYGHSVNGLAEL